MAREDPDRDGLTSHRGQGNGTAFVRFLLGVNTKQWEHWEQINKMNVSC